MEDGVGDAGDLDHFGNVVHADDVRPTKDRGRDRCGGAPNALAGRYRILGIRSCSTCPRRGGTLFTASHARSEEHTSELQSPCNLVCRLLLEKKKKKRLKELLSGAHNTRLYIRLTVVGHNRQ